MNIGKSISNTLTTLVWDSLSDSLWTSVRDSINVNEWEYIYSNVWVPVQNITLINDIKL